MSTEAFPPIVTHKWCRSRDAVGNLTEKRNKAILRLSPEFKERYGVPFIYWPSWAVRVTYKVSQDARIPRYRLGFEKFAVAVDFFRFCSDINDINSSRPIPVGRKDKEASWCQIASRKFDEVRPSDIADMIGKRMGNYNIMTTEAEVRESLKRDFEETIRQITSFEMIEYWNSMKKTYQGMDVSQFNEDIIAMEYEMSIMDINGPKDTGEEDEEEEEEEEEEEHWFLTMFYERYYKRDNYEDEDEYGYEDDEEEVEETDEVGSLGRGFGEMELD